MSERTLQHIRTVTAWNVWRSALRRLDQVQAEVGAAEAEYNQEVDVLMQQIDASLLPPADDAGKAIPS